MTRGEAIRLGESEFWKDMEPEDIALFQIHEPRLCMPFAVFREAVEKALDRPVYTHELGLDRQGLIRELLGYRPAPTTQEILELIPANKRIVIEIPDIPTDG